MAAEWVGVSLEYSYVAVKCLNTGDLVSVYHRGVCVEWVVSIE